MLRLTAHLNLLGSLTTVLSASPISPAISQVLRQQREEIALALVSSVADWDKYSAEISDQRSRLEFARRETIAFVDYLVTYFADGDPAYRSLYIGEKLKQCYIASDAPDEAIARRHHITASDRKALLDAIGPRLASADRELFAAELDGMHSVITKPGEMLCRLLLVGDCLFLDLLAFLTAPLMEAGIQLVPTFVTSKLLSAQHRELRRLEDRQFDLVFYSPLTYGFHPKFSEVQSLKRALGPPARLKALAVEAKRDIESTLQVMERLFECPIFVHNSANIRRHDSTAREIVKAVVTQAARRYTRRIINNWLPGHLEQLNARSHQHLFLLDETALFATASEGDLSVLMYNAGLQHPARFGQALAPVYQDVINARIMLAKKKLIICDLDNTLWNGMIGEGSVQHYADRQATLLALRRKGVLLAICSKNDPKNVHWGGGVLSHHDFVASQINWEPKAANIRRIAKHLNLKTKDIVFIDDRADERALVTEAMPEVTALDAESPRTWRQLALVASTIAESAEGDRTLAYKQKEERERFIAEVAPGSALATSLGVYSHSAHDKSEAEALAKLSLQLEIRLADRKELKRVSELINRTNQFNMCGSRTSLHEVARWHSSDRHAIWVAEARDKFGSMGTISAAVAELTARGVEILVFVLSCRVFGYGMENALLNRIKIWRPGHAIYGHFKQTPHNQPCHRTYPENGFTWDGVYWIFNNGEQIPDPEWLTVKSPQFVDLAERL
jgi:HAD superfamily phosphatase (TIGR01681 family)